VPVAVATESAFGGAPSRANAESLRPACEIREVSWGGAGREGWRIAIRL